MGKRLADATVLLHAVLVTVLLSLVPAMYFDRSWVLVELWLTAFILISWAIFGECPLKTLEIAIRRRCHPEGVYECGCIQHYVMRFLGVTVPDMAVRVSAILILAASLYLHFGDSS